MVVSGEDSICLSVCVCFWCALKGRGGRSKHIREGTNGTAVGVGPERIHDVMQMFLSLMFTWYLVMVVRWTG